MKGIFLALSLPYSSDPPFSSQEPLYEAFAYLPRTRRPAFPMHRIKSCILALASLPIFWQTTRAQSHNGFPEPSEVTIAGLPAPTDKPKFEYVFDMRFSGGRCTNDQQSKIRTVMKNVAGLADRGRLWKQDAFHKWQSDMVHWLGRNVDANEAWIKSASAMQTCSFP